MPFFDKLNSAVSTLSYEVFPPKNPAEWGALYETLSRISQLFPDFVSVTYRGGVSTRQGTVELVNRIQKELEIETVAHLTCITHEISDLRNILKDLQSAGIKNIIALRGDLPKSSDPIGLPHATDLISLAKNEFAFKIACAFYPEKHPDAATIEDDIRYLKLKQDTGASFAISQFFFDNSCYYRFRDKAVKEGVSIPLIAGVMPVSNIGQLKRLKSLSGTDVSDALIKYLGEGDIEAIMQRGEDFGVNQCDDLLKNGVAGIHLYTLNKSRSTAVITGRLNQLGWFLSQSPISKSTAK
jgi:methylenetetrahydrofolate reductase (NADPH)